MPKNYYDVEQLKPRKAMGPNQRGKQNRRQTRSRDDRAPVVNQQMSMTRFSAPKKQEFEYTPKLFPSLGGANRKLPSLAESISSTAYSVILSTTAIKVETPHVHLEEIPKPTRGISFSSETASPKCGLIVTPSKKKRENAIYLSKLQRWIFEYREILKKYYNLFCMDKRAVTFDDFAAYLYDTSLHKKKSFY